MKRIFTVMAVCVLSAFTAAADGIYDSFAARVASSSVTASYVMRTSSGMSDSGTAYLCGESWHIDREGFDLWCDGRTVWTVDGKSKEVVVEDCSPEGGRSASPVAWFGNLSLFAVSGSGSSVYGGRKCHWTGLTPSRKGEISELKLYFDLGGSLFAAELALGSGGKITFEFSGISYSDKKKTWSFDTSSLDSSWVVTDMRGF